MLPFVSAKLLCPDLSRRWEITPRDLIPVQVLEDESASSPARLRVYQTRNRHRLDAVFIVLVQGVCVIPILLGAQPVTTYRP